MGPNGEQTEPELEGLRGGALARGLGKAMDEIRSAKEIGLAEDASILRIAVWHHPVTGNDKIMDDAFLEQLQQAGVRLCLHGHVREDLADLIGYMHPKKIYVVKAGSFGARARLGPDSTPRLFKLLEIARDLSEITVHTHCMRKEGGAREGYAVWPGPIPTEKRRQCGN
jgi:hypothetical protein